MDPIEKNILDLPADVLEKIIIESGFSAFCVSKAFRRVYRNEVVCEILVRKYGLCKGLDVVCERSDADLVGCMMKVCDEAGFLVEYSSKVLINVVKSGQLEICKLLLDNGARADEFESISLAIAVEYDNLEMCKLLIENGAKADDFESDALYGAVKNGNIEICKLLLDKEVCGEDHVAKADARNGLFLRTVEVKGYLEIYKLLMGDGWVGH